VSRGRSGLAATAALAAVAAATTWVAMFSWRGFSTVPGEYLGPLFMLGLVVAGTGRSRAGRVAGVAVVGFQLLVSGWSSARRSADPRARRGRLGPAGRRVLGRRDERRALRGPGAAHVPGVHPLVIAGGLACLLLVDLLACTLRRAPLAGLPLLTIYSVPVSMVGGGVTWWIFALTAAGSWACCSSRRAEQVARWGRPLGVDPAVPTRPVRRDDRRRAPRPGPSAASPPRSRWWCRCSCPPQLRLFDFGPGPAATPTSSSRTR
jgi:hypothetical protein